ncbi:MAG: aldo/keto reductase [Kiritimatiellia bacterium]|jgi:aryl-alcohol dehydrogenase-like predicted oxidoreductase|nr:aldo/keto reductase [Kiritimatiellia bacterium]
MKQRAFGATGTNVSEVGLGCWQLGGLCWGDVDDAKAFEIMQAAVDNGVNFLDTSDVYGSGRSETLIGKFLKDCSEDVFVATKIGRFPEPGWPDNFERAVMVAHTDGSLKRLGVDALDLTQIHCIPTEVMEQGDVFDTLRKLKTDGKIKQFGASVESMDEALLCLEQDELTVLQVIFNIFRQKPIDTLFEKAKEKGVAIIARVPLASGLLTGKLSLDTAFAENDHRSFNKDGECFNVGETFAGLPYEKGVELSDRLKTLVPEGMSMVQMALRWILDHDAVSVVIPGASRPGQALGNAAISDLPPLSSELHEQLAELYRTEIAQHIRGPY